MSVRGSAIFAACRELPLSVGEVKSNIRVFGKSYSATLQSLRTVSNPAQVASVLQSGNDHGHGTTTDTLNDLDLYEQALNIVFENEVVVSFLITSASTRCTTFPMVPVSFLHDGFDYTRKPTSDSNDTVIIDKLVLLGCRPRHQQLTSFKF